MSHYINVNKLIRIEINELKRWYGSHNKVLNILCEPYEKLISLNNFISELLEQEELKILYINEHRKNIYELNQTNIEYISIAQIYSINKFYDLIIYDDISFYSNKAIIEVREDLTFLLKRTKKIIFCSVDEVFNNVEVLENINLVRKENFIEPRVIETRLNLKEAMPYLVYDYLRWFIKEDRILVINTPKKEWGDNLYTYYVDKLKLNNDVTIIKSNKGELIRDIERFKYRSENCFIITNELENYLDRIRDIDIIFYFSDDKHFDFKKIIYTCGALTRDEKHRRELLLICNEENNNIEKAKNIARRFNRITWEKENGNS